MENTLTIAGIEVVNNEKPYVIAEAGSNFNQSLDTAKKLIDVAAESGANAVKFQLFQAAALYPDGRELYDVFKSVELNPDWVPLLSDYANSHNLHFTASAFDITSLNILQANNVPFHKVASSETTNLKMVHRIANSGKPVVISTGMCDMVDVEEAVNVCLAVGNNKIVLMQCGTMYPLPPGLANLRVIVSFAERFGCPAGFSDNTIGYAAATASIELGCSVFEKHFTLDRNAEGPDHFYALEPVELKNYIEALHEADKALGQPTKEMLPQEREFGRREGLYLKRDMNKGEIIAINDIVSRRPALGLRTRYMPLSWAQNSQNQ